MIENSLIFKFKPVTLDYVGKSVPFFLTREKRFLLITNMLFFLKKVKICSMFSNTMTYFTIIP